MVELTKNSKMIVAFWVLGILAFIGYAYFATNETNPEFRSNISLTTTQEIVSVLLVLVALAVLTLILKGPTNRLTNLIGGTVVGIGFLAVLIDAVTVNLNGIYNLMMGAAVIMMILIIVVAYRMPKQQA